MTWAIIQTGVTSMIIKVWKVAILRVYQGTYGMNAIFLHSGCGYILPLYQKSIYTHKLLWAEMVDSMQEINTRESHAEKNQYMQQHVSS